MNRNNAIASLLLGGIIGITVSLTMFLVFADRTTPTQTYEKPNWMTSDEPVVLQGDTKQSDNYNPNFTSTVNPQ